MIHIVFTNIYENNSHVELMSEQEEFNFLLDSDDNDRTIYVHVHEKSLTRNYFIEPNLDKNGYLNENIFNKVMSTTINGIPFNYTITKEFDYHRWECK